jgi:hypothetical protein
MKTKCATGIRRPKRAWQIRSATATSRRQKEATKRLQREWIERGSFSALWKPIHCLFLHPYLACFLTRRRCDLSLLCTVLILSPVLFSPSATGPTRRLIVPLFALRPVLRPRGEGTTILASLLRLLGCPRCSNGYAIAYDGHLP